MQPRTLYTSLLMLAVIGSALGHYGRDFNATPVQLRQWIVNSLRHLERYHHHEHDMRLAKKVLVALAPDRYSFLALIDRPLDELCRLVSAYYQLAPLETLNDDVKEKYFDLLDDFWALLRLEL